MLWIRRPLVYGIGRLLRTPKEKEIASEVRRFQHVIAQRAREQAIAAQENYA